MTVHSQVIQQRIVVYVYLTTKGKNKGYKFSIKLKARRKDVCYPIFFQAFQTGRFSQ
ncbi:hypothetical protein SAMN05660816_03499 [Niastella yeongjuensis]|nr:hypothetical protein SAMN05660816_03499 [Niastella yeongjuensis]